MLEQIWRIILNEPIGVVAMFFILVFALFFLIKSN